jgi:hypothetical protein
MATKKAIDTFLKDQRRRSDFWKQSFFPLQVKQEKPFILKLVPPKAEIQVFGKGKEPWSISDQFTPKPRYLLLGLSLW